MNRFKTEAVKDLKDAILLTNELIVMSANSKPLTDLYIQTCLFNAPSTGLERWWGHVGEFFPKKRTEQLVSKMARRYSGSMWYLDHYVRHNSRRNASYQLKALALQKELDESFDFFEFTYTERLLDPRLYPRWEEADVRSRPLLESVLA